MKTNDIKTALIAKEDSHDALTFHQLELPGIEPMVDIKFRTVGPVIPDPASGMKYDMGKCQMGLLMAGCANALRDVADILTFGADKYEPNGWQDVPDGVRRYWDALYRHLNAYHKGEELDAESGMPHLSHAATNLMFIMELSRVQTKEQETSTAS